MLKKSVLLLFFMLACAAGAVAQTPDILSKPPDTPSNNRAHRRGDQDVSFPDDIRIRMAIERADSEYRKVIEDADKLNDMSSEVAKSYRDHGKLNAEELKKLSSIEKLAKRILSQAGGDEVNDKDKAAQRTLPEAVEQMSAAAAAIQKSVKEQTRFVVSATVIGSSNDVINLAQFIRHSLKTD